MNIRNILFYIGLLVLIVVSFSLYSLRFYPQLNSDDALNVLMTFYYKLPNDFYCWGQDRGGTFIPLLSQLFYKIFRFSAVTSVSISNYIVLIVGFIGFSSLFKRKFSKFLFAILWFLPAFRFIYLLRYPIGVEYSLIGFVIYLIRMLDFKNKKLTTNYLLLFSVIVLFIGSVWVSDLAIVTICIFLSLLYIHHVHREKKYFFRKDILLFVISGVIIGFLFIRYAKSFATSVNTSYLKINSLSEFFNGIFYLFNVLFKLLMFQTEEKLFSVYYWLTIILSLSVITLFLLNHKIKFNSEQRLYFYFFLADIVVISGILLFSKWVLLNHYGRRYFIGTYISFIIVLIIVLENSEYPLKYKRFLNSLITIIALLGSLSTLHVLLFINPKSLRSEISVRSEFLKYGKVGIIADYWNSYVSACPDPSAIKATPYEGGGVRNQNIVDEVFAQPNLFVIKDDWLKNFPDTLEQFGYKLLKQGNSFEVANCTVNKYIKIKRDETIPLKRFKYKPAVLVTANKIIIPKDSASLKNNYVIWGPYLPIGIGDFTLKYKIRVNNVTVNKPIAMFDVVADYGRIVLAKKELTSDWVDINKNGYFKIEFKTDKRYTNIEFRTYYFGNSDLIISRSLIKYEAVEY